MTKRSYTYDLIAMGRSSIDLYSNNVGAPFVEIESFASYVGGSPTNIAVGARRLGLRTALLTAVGEDPVGDFILNFLENEGVETKFIPRKSGSRSSAVVLGIEPPDKFPLVFYRDNAADIQLTVDDVLALPIAKSRALEISGTGLSKDPARSATIFAAEQAHDAGTIVFLDIDFRADQWHDPRAFGVAIRSVLPLVNVGIGTEEEIKAAMLTHAGQLNIEHSQISAPEISGDLDSAIKKLVGYGLEALIVKRGDKGVSIFLPEGKAIDVPSFKVEIYNVLGAGDAFASGFIHGYLKGWDWYKAARMGNACGAIVVTKPGVANFMPLEEEALQFIEERSGF
jgi:5-dehydro-2-deoxygluconokinase